MSEVQEFYSGRNVFITGGTGFLGKVLTEKLLRSCPDIGTIYLLVRAKKGKSPQERINALITDSVFDVLRNIFPDFSRKIFGVGGDIAEERLGLSTTDHARITDEVSVIFHLAATVRFNEKLEKAVAINVNSVKSVVDLAKACKNLSVAIYVSTAYSHCVQKTIDEKLYPPPLSYEKVNELVTDIREQQWTEDRMNNFVRKVMGEWPNTYSFTKAIAEGVVGEFGKELPLAIFRPSIVASAYEEPTPGWVYGHLGLSGMMCATGIGISHVNIVRGDIRFDVVPVDYVCNALVSSAWETASTNRRAHEDIPVYNYVSGNANPVGWRQYADTIHMLGRIFPTNRAIYYPTKTELSSIWIFTILEFFLHLIPALLIDSVAAIFGKHPGMYKIELKIGEAWRAVGYFTTQEWDFEDKRVQNLWKRMGPKDRDIFSFNMKNLDWDEYCLRTVKGFRKYMLGDIDGNVEQARRRHYYLYMVHTMVRLTFGFLILWTIWNIFCGWGFSTV